MVNLEGRTISYRRTTAWPFELVCDPTIDLSGRSGSKQVRFGVLNQDTRLQPDDEPIRNTSAWLFLYELRFESREKVATLLELMPGLE